MKSETTESVSPVLEVRVRETVSALGEEPDARTFQCPHQGHSVEAEGCLDCPRREWGSFDDDGRLTAMTCRLSPESALVHDAPARAVTEWAEQDLAQAASRVPLAQLLAPMVLCVREDLPIEALEGLLLERHISGVPVVNAAGEPVGVVTKTDLVRDRHENGSPDRSAPPLYCHPEDFGTQVDGLAGKTVADVMTPLTFALPENASVGQAAALMAFEGVHRVTVLRANRKRDVVGVVSSLDILRWLARLDGFAIPKRRP